MITVFKDIRDISAPFYKDVEYVFNRIQTGAQKELIEKIREESDKTARNELKKGLQAICFSGEFTKRNDKALSKHSGLICLDFDDYPSEMDMIDEKEALIEDQYVYAVFVSPSGKGLKVLVRIPAEPENHKRYFGALQEHFDSEYFDVTSKNVSRVCYESYDPNLYINEDAETFTHLPEEGPKEITREQARYTVPITNTNKVVDILMKWWNDKYGLIEGQRNHNVFILAKALNEYGVPRSTADYICMGMSGNGFTEREIKITLDSAYGDTASFNTKAFEDTEVVAKIRGRVISGEDPNKIIRNMAHIQNIEEVVEAIESDPSPDKFWTVSSKGVISIVPFLFKQFLEFNGFYKFTPHGGDVFVFVRVTNNLIDRINEKELKDFVLGYLMSLEDLSVYNYFAKSTQFFKSDFLSLIDTVNVHFVEDTQHFSHIYYQNCVVKVTAKDVQLIDYIDLDGFVWRDQVIKRDFEIADSEGCDFIQFISNLCGGDENRIQSMRSTIGFLLSSYKDPGYCPAVILNDEVITDNPEGGTGKGLMVQGIGKLKKVVDINGKLFDFKTQFAYQTVNTDTQVVSFDDVKRGFNFENLFSTITEGMTIEKKNKDAIKIPFSSSPKIVITTNYAIRGKGNSFARRKWELELRKHYHMGHTPVDEFGRRFFDEWDEDQWLLFDNYMISNLQLYISSGLIACEFNNLSKRRLGSETCHEFLEWVGLVDDGVDGPIKFNKKYPKEELYMDFIRDNPDFAPSGRMTISRNRFYKWLTYYGQYLGSGYDVTEGRDSQGRHITFRVIKSGEEKTRKESPAELDF